MTEEQLGDCTRSTALQTTGASLTPNVELLYRCRELGPASLSDLDVLTILLAPACRWDNANIVARQLLTEFQNLARVLNAPRHRLLEIEGIGEVAADTLSVTRQCVLRCVRAEISEKRVIECYSELLDYVQVAMGNLDREQFRVLFLNHHNYLIADEVLQEGTVNHTPVYPREVMRRALAHQATALILIHNHPSGDPTPSRSDIEMTRLLVEAAKVFEIVIHDHIIVSEGLSVSFRGLDLL